EKVRTARHSQNGEWGPTRGISIHHHTWRSLDNVSEIIAWIGNFRDFSFRNGAGNVAVVYLNQRDLANNSEARAWRCERKRDIHASSGAEVHIQTSPGGRATRLQNGEGVSTRPEE